MISRSNIKTFDYLFQEGILDNNSLSDLIVKFFENNNEKYIKFIKENKNYFERPDLLIASGDAIVCNNYPRLNNYGKIEYLNYKLEQLKNIINKNTNYDFNNIEKDINLTGEALIKAIDYFIDKKILICEDEYYHKNIEGMLDYNFKKLIINYNNKNGEVDNKTTTENQTIININGDKNIFNKNDFSNKKEELEKEKFIDKIIKFIKYIFKKN